MVGGDFYLISLTQKVSSSLTLNFMHELFYKVYSKKFNKISNEIIEEAYDETKDVFDYLIMRKLNYMK